MNRCEKCQFPGSPWRGKLSRKELRRVCERLQIKHPVRVIRGGTRDADIGTYDCTHFCKTREHKINLTEDMSARAANGCLIHELTHAAQIEREANPVDHIVWYNVHNMVRGYKHNPLEIEARKNSDEMGDDFHPVVA